MAGIEVIDWESSKEERGTLPADISKNILSALPSMPGHVWMATSGSVSARRLVALSKEAFLVSAKRVNEHLAVTKEDKWLNCLPEIHVGGLSIFARAHASGSQVLRWSEKWNVEKFFQALEESQATLLSLVPTQLYDLVKWNKPCPSHVRAIIVGGGAMRELQYSRARQLGYPVLPSYGLTECASQVATASLDSLKSETYPSLEILKHVEVKSDINGILHIKSKSLCTGLVEIPARDFLPIKFTDPKKSGWYDTDDHVDLVEGRISKVLGRRTDIIKVSGELVHLGFLQHMWDSSSGGVAGVVVGVPDPRRDHNVVLVLLAGAYGKLAASIAIFEEAIANVTKLSSVYYVDEIPYSEMGKLRRTELLKNLGFSV
jgi:O-succinylbenzoic acid--CoA ligase